MVLNAGKFVLFVSLVGINILLPQIQFSRSKFLEWKEGNVGIKCEIKSENLQELDLLFWHHDSCMPWFSAGPCVYFIFWWEGSGTGGDEVMSTWIGRMQPWEVHKLKEGTIFEFLDFSWAKKRTNSQIMLCLILSTSKMRNAILMSLLFIKHCGKLGKNPLIGLKNGSVQQDNISDNKRDSS